MKIKPFQLERYFSQYEFTSKHLLSSSDCDGLCLDELLHLATPEERSIWDGLRLGYTESTGLPMLRDEITKQYKTIAADEVVVMSPGEANFILMNVLLEKEDHVICMAPAYQSLYEVVHSIGCQVSFWKPSREDDWYFDPDVLADLFKTNTKLLIINFPHNPTGYVPGREDFDQIISLARKNNAYIFSDEMYRLLIRNQAHTLPPVCDVYDRGISLWGMAKTFALAGLRIGWVATKDKELLEQMTRFKDYLTICNSATSEILAWIGLRHQAPIIARNNDLINGNLDIFREFCERSKAFSFYLPKGGSTAFAKFLLDSPTLPFSERLVTTTGIMTLPAEMFEYGERHIRIGFGRKSMPEVLLNLSRYLEFHYQRG